MSQYLTQFSTWDNFQIQNPNPDYRRSCVSKSKNIATVLQVFWEMNLLVESSPITSIFVTDMIPETQSITIPPYYNEKKNREKVKMETGFNFDSQRNQNPISFTKSSNYLLPFKTII